MPSCKSLPMILVTASDVPAAAAVIADLVDVDVTEEYEAGEGGQGCVWRIQNKYYTADVRLVPDPGQERRLDDAPVHAHIICLNDKECSSELADARKFPGTHGVRLVLAQCEVAPDSLLSWANKHRYEVVPLLEQESEEEGGECEGGARDLYGLARARAALHAHVWPARGLDAPAGSGSSSSCGGSDAEWEDSDSERAEQFARALAALAGARDLPPAARADAAPALLHAFCAALGHDLASL